MFDAGCLKPRLEYQARLTAAVLAVMGITHLNRADADTYSPPAGYYSAAIGAGTVLKDELYAITLAGFRQQTYGDARYTLNQLWQDPNPNNSANLTEIYTSTSVNGTWANGVTGSWNREHLIPEHFIGISNIADSNHTFGADEFELAPADPGVNSSRGDGGYGYTGAAIPAGGYGNVTVGSAVYWNAGSQFRGDVARSVFYMATRYGENQKTGVDAGNGYNITLANGPPVLTAGVGALPGTCQMGDLNTFLHWAYEDPVDTFERRKNQLIYTGMAASQIMGSASQGNRNPYIDHPEYIWAVFGTGPNTSQLSVGSNVAANGVSSTAVNLGRVIAGTSFGTSNVTLNKTGLTPTTFNVTTSGSASSSLAGTGETFNYSSSVTSVDTKTMAVGLASPSTGGAVTGSVTISNTDLTTAGVGDGSADGDDTVNISGTAVDHSNASFSSAADVDHLTLSFGSVAQNSGSHTMGFSIADLLSASGYTAGLDLDSIGGTGNTGVLSTTLATFSDETAGTSDGFSANIDSSQIGTYSAEYTLSVSDENIPGATAGTSLVLDISGSVTAVPEPGSLMLMSVMCISVLRRKSRGPSV